MHNNLRNQTVEKGKNEERRSQTLPNKSVRYKRCSTNLNKQHRKKRVGLSIYNVVKNPSSLTHTLSTHNLRALRLSQNPISLSLSLYKLRSLSLSLNGLCYRNFDFHGLLQGQLGNDISIFVFVICFSFIIQSVNRCFQIYDFFFNCLIFVL